MRPVVTGIGIVNCADAVAGRLLDTVIKPVKIVTPLEKISIGATAMAISQSRLKLPIPNGAIGLYIAIDDAIEDIKDEYFRGIIDDGSWGASPLIFPFTSPNAIAAQVSIAFELRGESILMPINRSCTDMIKYAAESVLGGYSSAALAGVVRLVAPHLPPESGRYLAKFILIEREADAIGRGAEIIYPMECEELEII